MSYLVDLLYDPVISNFTNLKLKLILQLLLEDCKNDARNNNVYDTFTYVVCPKSKCTDFLFKCLLDSPEITSYLLQSMTLGKLHSGSNVSSTDHSSNGSYFP